MLIKSFAVGAYETNCYIIADEATLDCAVIDPGADASRILDYLEETHLRCRLVLLTHGHFDHTGGVLDILAETDAELCMHKADVGVSVGGDFYRFVPPDNTRYYAEGDVVCVGSVEFSVLETPGHTKGTISPIFDTEDNGKIYRVGMFGGAGANTLAQGHFDYEGCREDYRASLHRLRQEKVEVFIGNHVWNNDTEVKGELLQKTGENKFIDGGLCWRAFLDFCEARLDRTIAKDVKEG